MRKIVGGIGVAILISVLIAGFIATYVYNTDPATGLIHDGFGRTLFVSPFIIRFIFGQDRLWPGFSWAIADLVIFWGGMAMGFRIAAWGFLGSDAWDLDKSVAHNNASEHRDLYAPIDDRPTQLELEAELATLKEELRQLDSADEARKIASLKKDTLAGVITTILAECDEIDAHLKPGEEPPLRMQELVMRAEELMKELGKC